MTIRTIFTGLALGAALLTAAIAAPSHAADSVKIGDMNSYTRLPAFTVPYKMGLDLAVEHINAKGGVLGGRMIEVVSRDDLGKPDEAVKIAEEMFSRDGVVLVSGNLFSHVGLALASYAKQKKKLYLASEPLADALVWEKGNRYTFRLRPSTYMQAAMLAEEAAKTGAKRWATIAPNYAYGKEAVAAFKQVLTKLVPDVEFVAEQWPALFKIDGAAEAQALAAANPEAIYNVTFGSDLAKFAREGSLRNLFDGKTMLGLLGGEPEYLDPLKDEAPEGWIVTGYPWYAIETPEHTAFKEAYEKRYGDYPRNGSLVGYNTMLSIAAAIEKAGSTETEALVEAFKGLKLATPVGEITYRAIDHQSTMGAFVGKTAVKDGKGIMVDWTYRDGADYLPSDDEVRALRPAE
ncbi:ABC transporter substrate-binding protein [Nisaea sediminum]|uniref:ABC transporter substrate-binding protein n=1 Tax=Nisaea sediminum TaxID=2775867 RepID=UPI001867F9DF|nr:ABC transporter substrate-binding protein [Nisaea sediminum]